MCRCVGPLGWRIGRVVIAVEGSPVFEGVIFFGIFAMSVGVAVYFPFTRLFCTGAFQRDLNIR